jgi:hypothetical protein
LFWRYPESSREKFRGLVPLPCFSGRPWQGKSGLFWGPGVARMKKMKRAQKQRLFSCIVLAAKMEVVAKIL